MIYKHNEVCEMLKNATPSQLRHALEAVTAEQNRRTREVNASKYGQAIYSAIHDAVKEDFIIEIRTNGYDKEPDVVIHSNNLFLTTISVKEEDE